MCAFFGGALFAQTHNSVPVDNQVYHILEHAQMRGLCAPLSGVRPYTQSVIVNAINEIISSGKLNSTETEILERYLARFSKPKEGIDWTRGAWFGETTLGKNDMPITGNFGIGADLEGSAGIYSTKDRYFGMEIWAKVFFNGDLGNNVSYSFDFQGGLMQAPRKWLGTYHTFYEGFNDDQVPDYEYISREIEIYSEPLTHFPYNYKKRWDGSVFSFSQLDQFETWPTKIAGGYSLPSELTASFFENKLIMRLGRLSHDWGSTSFGSSLSFNKMARPFFAVETEFNPVSWFGISSLTGILEYYNTEGIYVSSWPSQNAFSITMLQFRYKNYLFLDFTDAAIWPKRFELGYMSPITNSFFYQNNVGKFDNMAITLSLKAQYPGIGNIWFSIFIDEMNLTSNLWTLDRQMLAMQAGLNVPLPLLSFSSLKLSYTRINPYCYTHHRNLLPWYGDIRMEKSYSNNGVNLGYYLPPNSDEILLKYTTMPAKNIDTHFQYQLIRHGADFGPNSVDGSNILSELDTKKRDDNPILKRYFLKDGAYQWMHVAKIGANWNLSGLPISFYGEAGVNYSYFTNIDRKANNADLDGEQPGPRPYRIINTDDYTKSTGFIVVLGVKIFPR